MDEGTIKTQNLKCRLVFYRVYRLEIQSVMLVFLIPVVNCCPSTFYRQCVAGRGARRAPPPGPPGGGGGGGGGRGRVVSCVVDYILQEFNTQKHN
jgi:hypothetical protein